ncbi:acyltransferase [Paenibacillus sp. JDR-2]|uniref:acyltransferase n=1 Tax=Paenibacillus sp. (strain JDR-2) TaxID=324057 RepID=UPI000166B201|nr:acyltransferase [Paenibacillus sp. JDR-2]ACS99086.1 transferase hexapeptide repeat containing protein [Paenibacillus sp. JDR-2]
MNSNWFKILMKVTKVRYGKKLLLKGIPVIFNKSGAELIIGDNVTINSSFLSNLVGLYQRTIIVTRTADARIRIGSNVGISGATIYARKSIQIGNNTLIGGNTKIIDNDFHPVDPNVRSITPNDHIGVRPIEIGQNVFIGCNCLILKGAKIGDNAVIGAGSVVSGEIPANCVAAGNPVKVIRYLEINEVKVTI